MKAYLIFGDGTVFEGESIGKAGQTIGEAVFTTGMTGYIETLTDPSFFGQMITFAFPMIGNYGAMLEDQESDKVYAAGCIMREMCENGSNFRKDCELNEFLLKHGVVGIAGVDTREITKKIRTGGTMNVMISDNIKDLPKKLEEIKAFKVKGAAEKTSCKKTIYINADGTINKDNKFSGNGKTVVLWDFGTKANIERELLKRGLNVIKVPFNTSAKEITSHKPHGIVISNGGGDPAENKKAIEEIKLLTESKIPMFGICMGHQLMCLAAGAKTKKLKNGHRGNQPVKDMRTGRVYVTSQNHGYAVAAKTFPEGEANISFISVHDKSCEGVDFLKFPGFSVQFHPESYGGSRDTEFLFDRFVKLMD